MILNGLKWLKMHFKHMFFSSFFDFFFWKFFTLLAVRGIGIFHNIFLMGSLLHWKVIYHGQMCHEMSKTPENSQKCGFLEIWKITVFDKNSGICSKNVACLGIINIVYNTVPVTFRISFSNSPKPKRPILGKLKRGHFSSTFLNFYSSKIAIKIPSKKGDTLHIGQLLGKPSFPQCTGSVNCYVREGFHQGEGENIECQIWGALLFNIALTFPLPGVCLGIVHNRLNIILLQ